jgi:hypothetical protein
MRRVLAAGWATLRGGFVRRLVLVSMVGACFALVSAGPLSASARTPDRVPLELPSELVLPAGDPCPWEGLVTWPVNREFVTIFYDADGSIDRVMFTGFLSVTIENVENHESVTLKIPGTGVIDDDVVVYRGRNVIAPVHGELNLVSGRVVATIDSQGFQHPVEVAGSTTDICALLA